VFREHRSDLELFLFRTLCQLHSNFFFTEAPKKNSGFRSTEETVKISVQFCDFWSSVIQVYGLNLQFSGSIRKNFGNGNGSFWKKKIFFSFLSCLGLEPRDFGFKVNNLGQVSKILTNLGRLISNLYKVSSTSSKKSLRIESGMFYKLKS
jgi:hypothetical protein